MDALSLGKRRAHFTSDRRLSRGGPGDRAGARGGETASHELEWPYLAGRAGTDHQVKGEP